MDPIAIANLAISAWTLLEPYVQKLAGKLTEKAGKTLPNEAVKVWDTVKAEMESNPETQSLPTDFVKAPDDEDTQGAFKYQLKKLLENDEAFAKRLEELVNEAKGAISFTAGMKGDGVIAQGDHSVAVGRGGIHIGGNVSESNIIAGDSNVINGEKKGKRRK